MNKFYYLFLYFIIYAFIGFIVETIYVGITRKKLQNRGFLIGPILPIYGFGCVIITTLLSNFKYNPVVLFIMAILVCSILEYLTSYLLEKIFNARWWDYSNCKYNVNGRICLDTLIPFGLGGTILCYFVAPFIEKVVLSIPINVIKIVTVILFVLFLVDFIISIITVSSVKKNIKKGIRDNTLEIKEKVKDILISNSILRKRLIISYPNIYEKVKDIIDKGRANFNK